jgi:hypothetical protein
MQPLNMMVIDFGASNGRTMLGRWNGSQLTVEEYREIQGLESDAYRVNLLQ